jgi:hypothetical protein
VLFVTLNLILFYFRPSTNAIMGLTFANYVIQPFFPECKNPDLAVRLLAAAAICKSFSELYSNMQHWLNLNTDYSIKIW